MPIDVRVDAVRGDLADVELADRVFAPHYAKSCDYRVTSETPLRASPTEAADVLAVLNAGEAFALLDISGSWGWGRSENAVGYVLTGAIEPS